jgi:hypothetical protein
VGAKEIVGEAVGKAGTVKGYTEPEAPLSYGEAMRA